MKDVLRYLREREIVHYQRFMEGLGLVQEKLHSCNYYAFNPSLPRELTDNATRNL